MTDQARKARQYPSRAVAALSKLDEGNRLVDRCRYYLEQFSKVLDDPGQSLFCLLYVTGIVLTILFIRIEPRCLDYNPSSSPW
jgi:hypothetical protein